MFERFTDRARRVLVLAQEESRLLNHSFIGTEHILLGLIHEGGVAAQTLEALGLSLEDVREKVEETVGPTASAPTDSPPFTPRAKKVLELALREALQLGHNHIGTEHILLGLVREGEGVAAQILLSYGADQPTVRLKVLELMAGPEGAETSTGGRPVGISPLKRRGSRLEPVAVGKEWFAQVVRAGRRPEDYASAYGELAELSSALGCRLEDMDSEEITCVSVETTEGPGFLVSVKHRIEDEPPAGEPAI